MRTDPSRRILLAWPIAALLMGASAALLTAPPETPGDPPGPAEEPSSWFWFKGNTHTHTLNSDGDSPPGEVAHWYRDHGYDFLVLSDHNYRTEIETLQEEFDRETERLKTPRFLLIPGEEVTDGYTTEERDYAIHVNGVDTERGVGAQGGESVRSVLQRLVDAIREAHGVPHVNHPNFKWSLTADDIHALSGLDHFEIYNGHPQVHNQGGGGSPSLEEMWDEILSRGRRIYGVAVDDAHHFQRFGPDFSNPGRGWIVVRAPELGRKAIRSGFERGDFYASTGVELEDVSMEDDVLAVRIRPRQDFRYRTVYIGKGGRVLDVSTSLESSYALRGDDLYVRARIVSSGGELAWTQPLFRPSAVLAPRGEEP